MSAYGLEELGYNTTLCGNYQPISLVSVQCKCAIGPVEVQTHKPPLTWTVWLYSGDQICTIAYLPKYFYQKYIDNSVAQFESPIEYMDLIKDCILFRRQVTMVN